MIFGESRAKDLYRLGVWGPLRATLEHLPPPTEARVVRAAGRLAAAGLPQKRENIRRNLARAFPQASPADLDRWARDAFASHFANQYASFSFGRCTTQTWRRYLRFEGIEHLEAARAQGRGVVLVHPHMGPAQLPLHVLALRGWPMHQIGGGRVTLVELSRTGQWAARTRTRLEARMPVQLHDGKRFLRPVLRALGEGAVVMSAGDGTGGGEELGRRERRIVLGQPLALPVSPAWMALRADAPLLTICCYRARSGDTPYVAEIGPALPIPRDQPTRVALGAAADQLAVWLDHTLRTHPGDWLFWDGFEPGGLIMEAP